jgi:hypothetical protein
MGFLVQLDEAYDKKREGLEKAFENQDNTRRISSLAFWHRSGWPSSAGSKPADLISVSKEDILFYALSQRCKTLVCNLT